MLVYYFVPFIVSNRYLLFWVSNGHNSVTVQNRTHVYMKYFHHKDLGNHLLHLCPKVVKHSVYLVYCMHTYLEARQFIINTSNSKEVNQSFLSPPPPKTVNNLWFVNLPSKGGSQLTLASVWESRNISTWAVAFVAPARRALISPDLSGKCMTCTLGRCFAT